MISLDDGTLDAKTWTEADNALLPRIRFARQNGVALIESEGVPGTLVSRWGPGNWAGNEAKAAFESTVLGFLSRT